jgi:diguanylate cyclase (GGDEF)-like protein/PAS domain S-box-containing protein
MSDWTVPPPRQPPLWLTSLLLLVTLAASVWFVEFVSRYGDEWERHHLQTLAVTAAASLPPEWVIALNGTIDDADSDAFAQVRRHLKRVHSVNPDYRFIYLMRPNAQGQLVFLADAEPADSADYSAPGDVYDGPQQRILEVFNSGAAGIEDPARDRWGFWATGLAPVIDPSSGRVVAVLGMDMSAEDWLATNARYRNFALTISALALTLVVIFLIGTRMQQRSRLHIETINSRLAHELAELARTQEDLRLADVVVRNTEEGVMVLGADLTIQSVNPAFERITGFKLAEVRGQSPRMLGGPDHARPGFIESIRNELQTQGKWEGTLPARRHDGEQYPQETTVNAVRNAQGDIQHYAVVFRDATRQKQFEERLRMLSATDGLTQVANRRWFNETLEREWNRALRNATTLSLILADIDHFKRYNDIYGHVAGDECLKQVAAAMRDCLHRGGDFVARYGGEEFAVILPGTDAAHAAELAEKIRTAVNALGIAHAGNPEVGTVSISLGTASVVPDRAGDGVRLVEAADRALYLAKNGGRNRVVVAS